MAFPVAITTIAVTATYLKADGTPASGTVSFTPSVAKVYNNAAGVMLPTTPLRVELDEDGKIAVSLAATDDADWGASFTYKVDERINGAQLRSYNINVPAASSGGNLDLSEATPV